MTSNPSPSPPHTLEINATAEDIRVASTWLERVASAQHVPPAQVGRLDLCLNEALANVLAYGGDAALTSKVQIEFGSLYTASNKEAFVIVSDRGVAFDPLHAPIKPRPTSLETAEPGGHGLLMLRQFSDRLAYDYVDGRNRLTFAVSWSPSVA
ncbi:MAG: ATP-binding protein [Burkholderiales bacterium]